MSLFGGVPPHISERRVGRPVRRCASRLPM